MDVAALIVATIAVLVAVASALYARRQAIGVEEANRLTRLVASGLLIPQIELEIGPRVSECLRVKLHQNWGRQIDSAWLELLGPRTDIYLMETAGEVGPYVPTGERKSDPIGPLRPGYRYVLAGVGRKGRPPEQLTDRDVQGLRFTVTCTFGKDEWLGSYVVGEGGKCYPLDKSNGGLPNGL
jgi:hypothetical protein